MVSVNTFTVVTYGKNTQLVIGRYFNSIDSVHFKILKQQETPTANVSNFYKNIHEHQRGFILSPRQVKMKRLVFICARRQIECKVDFPAGRTA